MRGGSEEKSRRIFNMQITKEGAQSASCYWWEASDEVIFLLGDVREC